MTAPIDATPKVLLLLHDEDGAVITITNDEPSLLLYAQIGSAITTAKMHKLSCCFSFKMFRSK
jgi:hypothetical protein